MSATSLKLSCRSCERAERRWMRWNAHLRAWPETALECARGPPRQSARLLTIFRGPSDRRCPSSVKSWRKRMSIGRNLDHGLKVRSSSGGAPSRRRRAPSPNASSARAARTSASATCSRQRWLSASDRDRHGPAAIAGSTQHGFLRCVRNKQPAGRGLIRCIRRNRAPSRFYRTLRRNSPADWPAPI